MPRALAVSPRFVILFVLLALGPLTSGHHSAWAQAIPVTDPYTIRGVEMDVSAASPQAAKDQAIGEGQRQAFKQLLERLTQPVDHARLPKVDGVRFVRDFSVEQERVAGNRYIATLTIRFQAASVKRLLRDSGIAFSEPRVRAVVVLPVFKGSSGDGRAVLWDDPNPWRAAWAALNGGGLVPLVVPTGDPTDAQTISVEQALAGDGERMLAEGARWRSADVLVMAAGISPNGRTLNVLVNATPGAIRPFDTMTYQMGEGENLDAFLIRAARDIARAVDTVYRQPQTAADGETAGTLPVLIPLSGLDEWLSVRERLRRVSLVRRWELVSLSKTEAAVQLQVSADMEQLRPALAGAGLTLDQIDGFWTLRQSAARP